VWVICGSKVGKRGSGPVFDDNVRDFLFLDVDVELPSYVVVMVVVVAEGEKGLS